MRTRRVLLRLTLYYLGLSAILLAAASLYPDVRQFLPIGGAEALLSQPSRAPFDPPGIAVAAVGNLGQSLVWLMVAIAGALLAAFPVSWTYMEIRDRADYDQSLVHTIVVLPIVVTGIVVVVQNSLALAFALAGIAAGVRFRNALKRTGDALFILLAIGIGLSAGIGAVELAIVMSIAFNYCFLVLWITDYGARKGAQRFLRRNEPRAGEGAGAADKAGLAGDVPTSSEPR